MRIVVNYYALNVIRPFLTKMIFVPNAVPSLNSFALNVRGVSTLMLKFARIVVSQFSLSKLVSTADQNVIYDKI